MPKTSPPEWTRRFLGTATHRSAHVRLALSVCVGLLVAAAAGGTDIPTRGLIGWDAGIAVLLVAYITMMANTTITQLKRKAAEQDETATTILALMVAAIAASLGGIIAELPNIKHGPNGGFYTALCLLTLFLSWTCMHLLFAVHYAHQYYGDTDIAGGTRSLVFPEREAMPIYADFVYFSFCIGMTYQVSDVTTSNWSMRRLITLHGGLSFFYNTVVLALAVSLLANLD